MMRGHWTVPRMWAGETVAILASGESMNKGVVASVISAGCKTIAINRTVELAAHADMLYAGDGPFWQIHEGARNFSGMKVSLFADGTSSRRSQLPTDDVKMLKNTGITGFDPDPSALRSGKNSGYAALHLAAHTGARRILLCGYNMGGRNWHPRYAVPLRNTKPEQYAVWRPMFGALAAALAALGIEVLNCTPGTALDAFRKVDLADVLEPVNA